MGFPYSESVYHGILIRGTISILSKHNIAIEPYLKLKDGGNNTMVVD